jgi:four helix bundle protein
MIKSYRDLEVYQRAYQLALKVHQLTINFPKYETTELGSQLRRAVLSIPLNIGEGYGRKSSVADFKRFLVMALGSCDEVRIELDFAKDLGYIDETTHQELTEEYIVLGKQIRVLHEKWE